MRQQECEAERNADSTREYLQQIDTLQVRSAFWRKSHHTCLPARRSEIGKVLHVMASKAA